MDTGEERWATLTARVWTEPSAPEGFRARVTVDDGVDAPSSSVVDNEADLVERMRSWLRQFLDSP